MTLKSVLVGVLRVGAAVGALAVGNPFLAAGILFAGNFAASKLAGSGGTVGTGATLAAKQRGLELNVSAPEAALPVVYGFAKIGHAGVDIRLDGSDNKSLAVVAAICVASDAGGGIEAIEKVWFDDVLAIDGATFEGEPRTTNVQAPWAGTYGSGGTVQYGAHAGTDAQVVDAELNTKFSDWGATDEGEGIAYLALWLYFDPDIWPFGIPRITYKVKGNLCFDVRDSSTVWTDNPVLHIYDWLTGVKYGLGVPTANMDSASFIAAANYADELVTDPEGGTQKRFTGGGAYPTNTDPLAVLEELKSGCRAQVVRIGGKYTIHIRQTQTAETFELTEDNILGEFEFWRGGVGQVPNQIAAVYVDAERLYKADTIMWPAPGATNNFLTADNSYVNQHQIQLPHTDQRYRAQQIAMTVLKELRADVGIALTANREALKLQHGDVVKVTHSTPAWSQKEFWVVGVGITPAHNVRLLLREYDATAYTIDAQDTTDSPPGTDLPDPSTIAAPTGVTSTADDTTVLDTQDGLKVPRIKLAWTAVTDPFLDHYESRFKVTADSDFTLLPNTDKDEVFQFIWPVTDGVAYTAEVRAVNVVGVKSDWATSTVTVATENRQDALPPFSDLEWYGPFDEGSGLTLRDRSGNVRDAAPETTSPAVITRVSGVAGGAIDFPGSGKGYELLSDAEADAIENLFYVSCWIKVDDVAGGASGRIIARGNAEYFNISVEQDEAFPQDIVINYSDTQATVLDDVITTAGVWYFLLAQWDQTLNIFEFWVGDQATGILKRESRATDLAAFSTETRILGIASNMVTVPSTSNPFDGSMDDVRIGAPAALLTQAQILALFRLPGVGSTPGTVAPTWETEFDRDAQGNATLTLIIKDPSNTIVSPGPQFSKRPGSQAGDVFLGFLTTWDTAPATTPPYAGTWIEALVVPGGEEAGIRWQYSWIDEDGVTRTHGNTHLTSHIDEHLTELILPLDAGIPLVSTQGYAFGTGGLVEPISAGVALNFQVPLPIPEGVVIEEFEARLYRDATHDICTCKLIRGDIDGAPTILATLTGATGGFSTQLAVSINETVTNPNSYHAALALTGIDAGSDAKAAWVKLKYCRFTQQQVY